MRAILRTLLGVTHFNLVSEDHVSATHFVVSLNSFLENVLDGLVLVVSALLGFIIITSRWL